MLILGCATLGLIQPLALAQPNVVVVMTDDQGYGDFGYMGNPVIRTPNLDALARESVRMEAFYVCPVCTPTRASLMTGRWHMRTRAIDTYVGRAMMDPGEVTVAEVLEDAGYATGIFGKWHLGDCPPMRPQDQGFQEVLVHRGGGIGQPSDPVGGERKYTDAVLFQGGRRVQTRGYCTDVYFTAALEFMERAHGRGRPFFCYLPTNAPHGPFHDVPAGLLAEYRAMDLNPAFPPGWSEERRSKERDRLARIYAMNTNVDENVGRLLRYLDRRGLAEDTIVIFLTDNGANGDRYNAGLRGRKGQVHEGGIRSPLLARWPGRFPAGHVARQPGAHIDLLPTLLEACGARMPEHVRLDGRSLLSVWRGDDGGEERDLVLQWHRGDVPVPRRQAALRRGRWKIVRPGNMEDPPPGQSANWQLYDLMADPGEQRDLSAEHGDVVARLDAGYMEWFRDVTTSRTLAQGPPLIRVGTPHGPEVVLTRQDWRHREGRPWGAGSRGVWHLDVPAGQRFTVTVRLQGKARGDGHVHLVFGDVERRLPVTKGARSAVFEGVPAHQGPAELRAWLQTGDRGAGAYQVVVTLERGRP